MYVYRIVLNLFFTMRKMKMDGYYDEENIAKKQIQIECN